MSIDLGTQSKTINKKERTSSASIYSGYGEEPSIQVMRETISVDDQGALIARDGGKRISRKASAIVDETYTLADGTKITAAHIMEALPIAFDKWAQE